eukprot:gene22491-30752_t
MLMFQLPSSKEGEAEQNDGDAAKGEADDERILKKSGSGEQQSTAKRVNYSSLPQTQKHQSQTDKKSGPIRNRRGLGTGSGLGPAAVFA